ncbi:MAG: hypothetical protein CR981_00520 [Proteobacteria bacterium]|nr:MAG: hypothetical protein CR981_00520 [Pseudomonadota bacterium]PIE65188.1 MAG: hypothetical protein CSA26_04950 [Desulfobacterales bacterium]
MGEDVAVFTPYPFTIGQKIRIEESPRGGDWEVVAIDAKKLTLRCPISGKSFTWNNFCYLVREEKDTIWPRPD